jgi:transposase
MKAKPKEPVPKATGQSTQPHWHQMNRKQRRDMERKIQSADLSLQLIHPDAAGVDIGNESHYVAVPPDRDNQSVRHFGCTTAELRTMAVWLKQCGIRTVAMQSTGVYWIAVYDVLEQAELEVYLVNARETKNLPGRKSDVQESQWLMKLHTYGLLRNSFRPSQEIRTMRTYWRQRKDLVESAGRHIQRMQKTLTQMNMQLANVLSDVSGVTGQAIIKSILAGERNPSKLAAFRDPRVKASEKEIARSLEGNWQQDLLFVLQQEQAGYEFCQKQMAECDRQLEQYLQQMEDRSQGAPLPEEKRKDRLQKKKGNKPQFDLRQQLFRMTGTDLTKIDGIDVMTAATILSEAGWDMTKWKDEHHFVSWLRLSPDNRISGDRIIGKGRLPTTNRITVALKLAASSLRTSQSYLGAQFRRFRARLDTPVAIKAMAAKLARLVYRMLRYGTKYVDHGAQFYEVQQRSRDIRHLKQKAAKLGFQLLQASAPAA